MTSAAVSLRLGVGGGDKFFLFKDSPFLSPLRPTPAIAALRFLRAMAGQGFLFPESGAVSPLATAGGGGLGLEGT